MSPPTDTLQTLIVDAERMAAATAEIEAAGFKVVPASEPVPPELLEEAENILMVMRCLRALSIVETKAGRTKRRLALQNGWPNSQSA